MERPQDNASGRLNPMALSRVNLAGLLSRTGVTKLTPAAIGNWLDAGCPRNADKSYNIVHVCAWLAGKYGQTPYRPRAVADEERSEDIRLKRERRLAVRQDRLIKAGRFIDLEDVRAEFARMATEIRGALLALPAHVAPRLGGQTEGAILQTFDAEIRAALTALADGKYVAKARKHGKARRRKRHAKRGDAQ